MSMKRRCVNGYARRWKTACARTSSPTSRSGCFFRGGIDSGAIVSLARAMNAGDLQAYTVVVNEAAYSEEALARTVAERFGITHHVLRLDAGRIGRDLDAIVGAFDQPTADAVNSYYVSQAVASTGVKAVLSGVGGDELFGGYPSFERIPAGVAVGKAIGPLMRVTGAAARLALPEWRAAKVSHFARAPYLESGYRALRGLFMPDEILNLIGPALRDPATYIRHFI